MVSSRGDKITQHRQIIRHRISEIRGVKRPYMYHQKRGDGSDHGVFGFRKVNAFKHIGAPR